MGMRKGEATVLTTTLLIAISVISASFVISLVQPQNYVPTADEPQILEKIDVVEVVRDSASSILMGIYNTGGYDAVVDMVYVADSQNNLVKSFYVGAPIAVDKMINIVLPTTGQDTSSWINFKAVTERGNSDTLQISTPADSLPGYSFSYIPSLIGVFFNGVPVTSPSELAKLAEVDGVDLNTTTQENMITNATVCPLGNQSFVVDPTTGGKIVGDGGSELHLIVANDKACVILGGLLPIDASKGIITKFNLNIVADFQPNKNITLEVSCYNFSSGAYDGPLPKKSWILGSDKPNINVTFGITNAQVYVDQNNGNFSVMVNFTFTDNPQNLKLDLTQIRITPEYFLNVDGLFVYEITQPEDLSKVEAIEFSVTNLCNISSVPFLLRVLNPTTNSWEVLGTYISSSTPNTPVTFTKSIDSNAPAYVGADRKVYINFVPASFILTLLKVSFDQARLAVTYIN